MTGDGSTLDDDEEYEVEEIVQATVEWKREKKIHWKYLVKWKGYSSEENTWEPPESFTHSRKMLRDFWRQADTGGRNIKNAKLFKIGEDFFPDMNDKVKETSIGTMSTTRQNKRDRSPSIEVSDVAGSSRSPNKSSWKKIRVYGKSRQSFKRGDIPDNNRRRHSSTHAQDTLLTKARVSRNYTRRKSMDHTASDDILSTRKLPSHGGTKSISRKIAYVEDSEGEDDISYPAGSHSLGSSMPPEINCDTALNEPEEDASSFGSLFSGDEESEKSGSEKANPIDPKPTTFMIASTSRSNSQNKLTSIPGIPYHRARAAKPLVQMIDDPMLSVPITDRLKRLSSWQSSQPGPTSSHMPTSSTTHSNMIQPSPMFRPGIITSVKGQLITKRLTQLPRTIPSTPEPPSHQIQHDPALPENRGAQNANKATENQSDPTDDTHSSPVQIQDDSILSYLNESAFNDLSHNTTEDKNDAHDQHNRAPVPADELLQLAGVRDDIDDLPDFLEDGEIIDTSIPKEISETLSMQSKDTWRQSTIFGPAMPISVQEEPPTTICPAMLFSCISVRLRMTPSIEVTVELKDVHAAAYDATLNLIGLLSGAQTGPPGKLYSTIVLDYVKTGGSSAQLSMPDRLTESQRKCILALNKELECGKLFIVAIGGTCLALCSSQNQNATLKLRLPHNFVGIENAVVAQHIVIEDLNSYVMAVEEAEDLKV